MNEPSYTKKLPFRDNIIFLFGSVFYKIGIKILKHKNLQYWDSHFRKLYKQKNISLEFSKHELKYNIGNIQVLTRRHSTDAFVFDSIFIQEEYKAALDIFALNKIPLHTFLDLGSNIGLTSLYVKSRFPDAKVVAVEPNKKNFDMLIKNFESNKFLSTTPILAGIGKTDCFLEIASGIRDQRDWSFSFKEVDYPTDTISYSVNTILKKSFTDDIDLLKIDIEGAEKAIFDDDADVSFLNKVKVIAIEIHDEFDVRDKIYKLFKSFDFTIFNCSETTIAVKHGLFDVANQS